MAGQPQAGQAHPGAQRADLDHPSVEPVGVAHVVGTEAGRPRQLEQPPAVTHPIGHQVAEPGQPGVGVVIGPGLAQALGVGVVPVPALADVGNAGGVGTVELGPAAAVLPGQPQGLAAQRPRADPGPVLHQVGHGERSLGQRGQPLVDGHVVGMAGLGPPGSLGLVGRLDRRQLLGRVARPRAGRRSAVGPTDPAAAAAVPDGHRPRAVGVGRPFGDRAHAGPVDAVAVDGHVEQPPDASQSGPLDNGPGQRPSLGRDRLAGQTGQAVQIELGPGSGLRRHPGGQAEEGWGDQGPPARWPPRTPGPRRAGCRRRRPGRNGGWRRPTPPQCGPAPRHGSGPPPGPPGTRRPRRSSRPLAGRTRTSTGPLAPRPHDPPAHPGRQPAHAVGPGSRRPVLRVSPVGVKHTDRPDVPARPDVRRLTIVGAGP